MASSASEIPRGFMRAEHKELVIDWILRTSLPSRFKRKLLQDWAEAVGVTLTGDDYALLDKKRAI